jgi:uroporphyrinogen decarboxylase
MVGSKFGYLITASCMPLLEMIAEAGVDVLIGVDPMRWDLETAEQKIGGKVCLWGGVNGHLTVEQGMASEVRAEVARALQILAPGGGFILSPVDNVRIHPLQENVQADRGMETSQGVNKLKLDGMRQDSGLPSRKF